MTTNDRQQLADVRLLVCGRGSDRGKSGASLQRAMDPSQRLVPFGDEHQRQPANGGIEGFALQFELTGIDQARLHVRKALVTGGLVEISEHAVGDVIARTKPQGPRAAQP